MQQRTGKQTNNHKSTQPHASYLVVKDADHFIARQLSVWQHEVLLVCRNRRGDKDWVSCAAGYVNALVTNCHQQPTANVLPNLCKDEPREG